jgi:hypothetical protein
MGTGNVISEYDPIKEFERETSGEPRTQQRYHAPGWARLKEDEDA